MTLTVTRLGVKVAADTLYVEYRDRKGILRVHQIVMKYPHNLDSTVEDLCKENQKYLINCRGLVKTTLQKYAEAKDKLDLSKSSSLAITKAKSQMSTTFQKNVISPDSPSFVYDKRQEFEQTDDANWDDSEEWDENYIADEEEFISEHIVTEEGIDEESEIEL